ncbi:hypothetical protein D9758_015672 [Tetrapyrgos nigripes]|uniref:Uncharacterized protein n=1 Tax=Tetrapyrgos nigripes TaxID=182062 RepID=A0A8H5C7I0_9AGAR|nr:hypothetical protein D9758_015672 [Tetrapyrgos nigripes]
MPPILQNVLSAANPSFQLDASGLAGFFGGPEAVSAMKTVQLYTGRRWLVWYNSPGGYEVAKHYGQLAKSPFWRGFCPGARIDPAELFGLNGHRDPEFLGVHTGVIMKETGHLGHLFFRNVKEKGEVQKVGNRETTPQIVTVVKLKGITLDYPKENPTNTSSDSMTTVPKCKPIPFTASIRDFSVLFGSLIPILSSLVCTIVCALHGDWFAFSLILLGMLANGITCCIFGSGRVKINFVSPPDKSPPGDGLMMLDESAIIVLGAEKEIYQVTRAHISVEFPDWIKWRDYSIVGCCSVFRCFSCLHKFC